MAAPSDGVKGSVARGTLADSVRLNGGEPEAVQLRGWGEELNEKQRVQGTDRERGRGRVVENGNSCD